MSWDWSWSKNDRGRRRPRAQVPAALIPILRSPEAPHVPWASPRCGPPVQKSAHRFGCARSSDRRGGYRSWCRESRILRPDWWWGRGPLGGSRSRWYGRKSQRRSAPYETLWSHFNPPGPARKIRLGEWLPVTLGSFKFGWPDHEDGLFGEICFDEQSVFTPCA